MNNKVFYQHPNLMRALGMHETVMEVMVNVLGGGGDSKVTVGMLLISLFEGVLETVNITVFFVFLYFFSSGDSIPSNGDQLLSLPVLLLSYQPAEPALHV